MATLVRWIFGIRTDCAIAGTWSHRVFTAAFVAGVCGAAAVGTYMVAVTVPDPAVGNITIWNDLAGFTARWPDSDNTVPLFMELPGDMGGLSAVTGRVEYVPEAILAEGVCFSRPADVDAGEDPPDESGKIRDRSGKIRYVLRAVPLTRSAGASAAPNARCFLPAALPQVQFASDVIKYNLNQSAIVRTKLIVGFTWLGWICASCIVLLNAYYRAFVPMRRGRRQKPVTA